MWCNNMCAISEGMNRKVAGESWTMNEARIIEAEVGDVRPSSRIGGFREEGLENESSESQD